MLFNSVSFLVFFPLTTLVYFLLPGRARWVWLLACSCAFYAAFIPAYLLVLAAMIGIDYAAGLMIERARAGWRRRGLLAVSLAANIGILASFKYVPFVNENLRGLTEFLHWHYPVRDLGWVLPIGLSFHTFQSMAYTIEVYRRRVPAERHLGYYALYVMFYPQLVAGPIERPQNLLPQLREPHPFDADGAFAGLKQMLWGMFKKVVIADRLAPLVDLVYADPRHHGGGYLLLATYFFAVQIYCDFSGYTDIAIGAARVLGIRLMTNFDRPYFASSVSEFWRRWHISLSSWFRDYLYIPLGGGRVPVPRWCMNVMIVFVLSGLWHGASWTFIVWGALHGIYLIAARVLAPLWDRLAGAAGLSARPRVLAAIGAVMTFNLVAVGWVFFRAASLRDALWVLASLFSRPMLARPPLAHGVIAERSPFSAGHILLGISLITFLFCAEWLQGRQRSPSRAAGSDADDLAHAQRHALQVLDPLPLGIRWAGYYALVIAILWIGALGGQTFIYFQF
jgi:D-alanyl-lipoteichoic acid acyltransferase DltB (MBOAT superfamily)